MHRHLLLLAPLLAAAPALADIPPPPGSLERWHGELIRKSGFECNEQPEFERATPQQAGAFSEGMDVRVVRCANGQRFLVATARRRPGVPRPDLPPLPDPVVQRLK